MKTVVEQLLDWVLLNDAGKTTAMSFFIGAGVSFEYGIPTTLRFALEFLRSIKCRLTEDEELIVEQVGNKLDKKDESKDAADVTDEEADELISLFIHKFRHETSPETAYSFFHELQKKALSEFSEDGILTLERIVDLWKNDYIKIVVTTNFDNFIEHRIEDSNKKILNTDETKFKHEVFDYNAIENGEIPKNVGVGMLIKACGDITRSNALWTHEDFEKKISKDVIAWIERKIAESPIVLLGYNANEKPLANMITRHSHFVASVSPSPLEKIRTLKDIHEKRISEASDSFGLRHAQSTANKFVETLYERIYEKTADKRLILSYLALKDRLIELDNLRKADPAPFHHIKRTEAYERLAEFIFETESSKNLQLVLGDAGHGKTSLLNELKADESLDCLSVFIPAKETRATLNDWFLRITDEYSDVRSICSMAKSLGKRIIFIVDGVNEADNLDDLRRLLTDIVHILDQHRDGFVKAIISCRNDFWNRIGHDFERNYEAEPFVLAQFNMDDVKNVLQKSSDTQRYLTSRYKYLHKLLQDPLLFTYFFESGISEHSEISELSLYNGTYKKRTEAGRAERLTNADHTIVWFCRQVEEHKNLRVRLNSPTTPPEVQKLCSAGILYLNNYGNVRFAEERMGEYIFGKIYLYDYKWHNDFKHQGYDFYEAYKEFNTVLSLYEERDTAYINHYFNALVFFVASCSDSEQLLLYKNGNTYDKNIVRLAALLRRHTSISSEYETDSMLSAVSLMEKDNYPKLLNMMLDSDHRFFAKIPFHFGAKLTPDNFLDFIEYIAKQVHVTKVNLENERNWTSILLNSILIYVLRNGPAGILAREELLSHLSSIVSTLSPEFLASKIHEILSDNSRALFHFHRTDKLGDLFTIDWYWKDKLRQALRDGLFNLEYEDICGLIYQNSATRLILRFLICLDYKNDRIFSFLRQAFAGDSLRIHDYCLGILGGISKLDPQHMDISAYYVNLMRDSHPELFYMKHMTDNASSESQYDPIVPHFTSMLFHNKDFTIKEFLPEANAQGLFRLGRLAQKTILDFPAETIRFMFDFCKKEDFLHQEIQIALRAGAMFAPQHFWREASSRGLDWTIIRNDDDDSELKRIISQVRDYDWFHSMQFSISAAENENSTREILHHLLHNDSLEDFLFDIANKLTGSTIDPNL